jgi:hypothetical protein
VTDFTLPGVAGLNRGDDDMTRNTNDADSAGHNPGNEVDDLLQIIQLAALAAVKTRSTHRKISGAIAELKSDVQALAGRVTAAECWPVEAVADRQGRGESLDRSTTFEPAQKKNADPAVTRAEPGPDEATKAGLVKLFSGKRKRTE